MSIRNSELSDILLQSDVINCEIVIDHLKTLHEFSDETVAAIALKLNRYFIPTFKRQYKNALFNVENFKKKNEKWLEAEFVIPEAVNEGAKYGQKKKEKDFNDCLERTKRIRLAAQIQTQGIDNIGRIGANNKIPKDEVLGTYAESKMTKAQYGQFRKLLNRNNVNVLPSYQVLGTSKEECYPESCTMTITDTIASIQLQAISDLTVRRLLLVDAVANNLMEDNAVGEMTWKYGCDGASSQSVYKQMFKTEGSSDEAVFTLSAVPLQLRKISGDERVIWNNALPSSIKNCRPIKFEFCKETPAKTREEVDAIKKQIADLQPTSINIGDKIIKVYHAFFCTMIDGKVHTVLTDTSSNAVCTVCGAKPSEMNDLQRVVSKPVKEDACKYGLSTLHAWIRTLEYVLNVAYRFPVKQWAVKTEADKLLVEENKRRIQKEMKQKLAISVSVPKQGMGTTNDGNTARTFFKNYKTVHVITGIDENLLKRLYTILRVMASGQDIDAEAFSRYTRDTAQLCIDLYPWYYMPASVHKFLIYGERIIRSMILPLGVWSEEAQEARNKVFKDCRANHTRKDSREHTNIDVLHNWLYSSDPLVVSKQSTKTKGPPEMDEECRKLLKTGN